MTTRIRWTAVLWVALGLLASTAPAAMAQGGGTLPVYGEPTIISTPGQLGVYAADFTGDNIPDIAKFSMTGQVTVYPGLGNGQVGPAVQSNGGMAGLLGFGDFNGDGTPDVAVRGPEDVMACSSEMGVMFGNGNGTFQAYRAVGQLPWETNPAVGDFDGDGRSDLAGAGLYHCGETNIKLGIVFLWGRADGGFDRTEWETDLGPTRINHALFAADVTGDGKPDLVWKKYPQGKFVVMPGLGSRSFGASIDHTSAGEPSRFASADFNADGKQDLAVLYSGGIGILHGNGDGSFQPVFSVGPWAHNGSVGGAARLLVRDLNGDTKPDLSIDAVEGVALLVNNGDGIFRRYALTAGVTEPHNYYSPNDYAVADFNADGRADFVAGWTDGKTGVYLGLSGFSTALSVSSAASTVGQAVSLTATVTPAGFTGPITFYDGASVLGSAALTGDRAVFTTTTLGPGPHVFRAIYGGTLMNAAGVLSSPASHTVGAVPARGFRTSVDVDPGFRPYGLGVADVNRDGAIDLVAADYWWDYRFGYFAGRGDGTLETAVIAPQAGNMLYIARWVILGDVNRDGNPDVCLHGNRTPVRLGNGDGTFSGGIALSDAAQTQLADVNGDGTLDQVFTNHGRVTVMPGTGDRSGAFAPYTTFDQVVASQKSEIALGDFNGDLKLDIAMTTAQENRLYVLLGNGDGTFGAPRTSDRGNGPTSPVVADFNADGKLDLGFVNTGSGKISILPGKGDGDFLAAIDATLGGTLTRMTAADLTGDGKVDLAVLSTSEDRVLVLPGNGNGTFGPARKHYAARGPIDVVTADFNGDGRMDLAVSSIADILYHGPARISVLLGVNPAPTSVLLAVLPVSSTLSDPVVMTATVSPPAATGWVTFNDGATPLGSVPVSGGQATFQTRLLGSGVHQLAAVFSGDGAIYGSSVSAPATVHVAAEAVVDRAPSRALSPSAANMAEQADFNGDGVADLVVYLTAEATVLLGQGDGQFSAATSVSIPTPGQRLVTADFNRDGKTDLVIGRTLAFGKGDGTFETPQAITDTGMMVLAADVNGDGAPDLVDANGRVFLNRGAGTFASPIQFSLGLTVSFWAAVAGDLNTDGRADLVVPDDGHGNVYILLATDDDAFLAPALYPTVSGPHAVAIADLNGDGIPDLAVGDYGAAPGRFAVMLGLGDGTFENWGDTITGLSGVRQLIPCDLDNDGTVDLLAASPNSNKIRFLRGLGNGTFEAAVDYASIDDFTRVLLADLNQDGSPDIVHNSWRADTPISVRMAVAASSLALTAAPTPADFGKDVILTASVTPADATGTVTFYDGAVIVGKAGIAGGQATLATKWLGAGTHALRAHYSGDPLRYVASDSSAFSLLVKPARSGGFGAPASLATARGPKGIAAGDLNGDGKQDLVVANATSNTVSVFLGNGTGGFATRVSYNTGSAPVAVYVTDLNDDGIQDVAAACSGSNAVSVLLGNGNGTLQAAVSRGVSAPVLALAAADVNLDQTTDLVAGTGGGGVFAAFMGAAGAWPASGWSPVWYNADPISGIGAVDMSGDGRIDIPAAGQSGNAYRLIRQPNGTYSAAWTFSGGGTAAGLVVADFNNDALADLAIPNKTSNNVGVLVGNGDGSFQAAVTYAVGTGPTASTTTDVDGDGRLDLVVANGGSNTLTLLRGQGDGTFLAGGTVATGSAPAGVVAGDFNGDGVVDVAVTNGASDTMSVFLGQAAPPSEGPRGDFTGDLRSDVLWRHATGGDVWLWPMDGPARTAETYVRTITDANWEIRAIADFDGDGKADLFWRNKVTGQLYFWPMDGAAPLDEVYAGTVDPAYDIVGSGDFNGDGNADLLWRHLSGGDVWVWLMAGATALDEVYIDRVDPAYLVKGVGDLDANGKADIVWHGAAGDVWVWPMNGATRLSQHWVGTVPDTGYQIVGVADHTGDGKADLLWHHATLGEVWIWTMDGTTRSAETWVGTVPDIGYQVAGSGDYNGDGMADILWHHATLGEVWVWLMDSTTKLSETWVATVPDTAYQIIK